MVGHPAEVVAYQVHDRSVFCSLLVVSHEHIGCLRHAAADGAFHGKAADGTVVDAQEGLGREAYEAIAYPQTVAGVGAEKDVAHRQVRLHGYTAREIGQISVAGEHLPVDSLELLLIKVGSEGMGMPRKTVCGRCRPLKVVISRKCKEQLVWRETVEIFHQPTTMKVVGQKEKRSLTFSPCVHPVQCRLLVYPNVCLIKCFQKKTVFFCSVYASEGYCNSVSMLHFLAFARVIGDVDADNLCAMETGMRILVADLLVVG